MAFLSTFHLSYRLLSSLFYPRPFHLNTLHWVASQLSCDTNSSYFLISDPIHPCHSTHASEISHLYHIPSLIHCYSHILRFGSMRCVDTAIPSNGLLTSIPSDLHLDILLIPPNTFPTYLTSPQTLFHHPQLHNLQTFTLSPPLLHTLPNSCTN